VVFDSDRLKPIIASVGEKLVPIAADKRLKDVQQTLTLVDGSIVEALPRIAMASFRDAQSGSGKKLKWTLHILEREAQSSGASYCDRSEATQVEGKAGDGIHWAELRRLPAHCDESAGTSAAWPTRKNCWLIWRNSTRSLSLENLSSDSRGHSSRVASPASRSADNNPIRCHEVTHASTSPCSVP
jgi:hypothetical protein